MDIIHNQKAKELLTQAQTSLETGDYQEAIVYATASLDVVLNLAKTTILRNNSFGFGVTSVEGFLVEDKFKKQKVDSVSYQEFQNMQEILLCSVLEINYIDYIRYRKIVGSVSLTMGGTPFYRVSPYSQKKGGFNITDANYSMEYCRKTIIQVEGKLKDIDEPFFTE